MHCGIVRSSETKRYGVSDPGSDDLGGIKRPAITNVNLASMSVVLTSEWQLMANAYSDGVLPISDSTG